MSTRFQSVSRFGLVLCFLAMLISGATLVVAQDGPTSDPADPLIAYVQGLWDTVVVPSRQVSQADAADYVSPSIIWHDPAQPLVAVSGPEIPMLDLANVLKDATSGRHYVIAGIVRYGDLVWMRAEEEMTLEKPPAFSWAGPTWALFELPMAIRTEEVLITRFKDDEVAEVWQYIDNPIVANVHRNGVCNGWVPPLAGADMDPSAIANVEDHTLLMEGEKISLIKQLIDNTVNASTPLNPTVMARSAIVHNPRGPEVWRLNPGSIREWFAAMHQMMPDFSMEIQHIVELDDTVWVHWRSSGTLTNPTTHPGLMGVNHLRMPHPVEAEGVYVLRFENDKIAEWWWYEDNGLLTVAHTDFCFLKGN